MPEPLILGLDSGGTKTVLLLADRQGRIFHRETGPGLNPFGAPGWQDQLAAFLSRARAEAPIAAAVLGLPFFGEMADVSAEQTRIAEAALPVARVRVINDVEAAFIGAFAGGPGVLLLAGTGSMAWAGDGQQSLRVGGFGEVFGDEGSAHWIGREALSRASRESDGRAPPSRLGEAVLRACGTDGPGLIGWAYASADPRAAIAGLSRIVSDCAEAGDEVALALLAEAALRLAEHVTAARKRLDLPALAWSHGGGVFASPLLLAGVARTLGPPVPPRLDPARGALLAASALAGWNTGPAFALALSRTGAPDAQSQHPAERAMP